MTDMVDITDMKGMAGMHKEPEPPVLWSFRRCPYAMRARLALQVAGIDVWLREVLLRDKPTAFLQTSEKGTVPVLVLADGRVVEESRDIMIWALSQNDPQGWLRVMQQDPVEAAAFLDRLDGDFKTHLDRYKYATRFDAAAGEYHRQEGASFLGDLEARLAAGGPQQNAQNETGGLALWGGAMGLLDFAALPFVRQFRIAGPQWFDSRPWPHLHSWLRGFLDSPEFASIMHKYTPWQPGEDGIAFPPG
jgi:glutathione S-transferase